MTAGQRVKVVKILDADRAAGYGSCDKPPKRLVGKIGTIRRPLVHWDGFWVSFGRGKEVKMGWNSSRTEYPDIFVFARQELKLVGGGSRY